MSKNYDYCFLMRLSHEIDLAFDDMYD